MHGSMEFRGCEVPVLPNDGALCPVEHAIFHDLPRIVVLEKSPLYLSQSRLSSRRVSLSEAGLIDDESLSNGPGPKGPGQGTKQVQRILGPRGGGGRTR